MNKITIFVGNYGSGKTEIALNAAFKLKDQGKDVILADIDIVNPYFRSSEHKELLNEKGIRVIMPPGANSNVDLPSLPVDIYAVFDSGSYVVMDCGGDPAGATALGALKHKIDAVKSDVKLYFVLNARRPLQGSIDETLEMLNSIEYVSHLKVDGIINNTNLADETSVEDLIYGQEVAIGLSEKTGIPISYISGESTVLEEFKRRFPEYTDKLMPINIYMRPYWQKE
ncbi:MAG: ATP-binding protein [Eubacteriales bacterium]